MDATRFRAMARTLHEMRSRRGALAVTLGGLGSLLGWHSVEDAAAHNPLKSCKKKSSKQKKACLKKAQKHIARHLISVPPPVAPLACGSGGPCLVFLSSTPHNGNFGGFGGADTTCQGLAEAAGLPGSYKAWLSDTTSSPSSRFVRSSGPYRLVTGTTIAANWADLTDGTLAAPITVMETGGGAGPNVYVWTHTLIDGTPGGGSNLHCNNWSSQTLGTDGDIGDAAFSDSFWTHWVMSGCQAPRHLYCFQQR